MAVGYRDILNIRRFKPRHPLGHLASSLEPCFTCLGLPLHLPFVAFFLGASLDLNARHAEPRTCCPLRTRLSRMPPLVPLCGVARAVISNCWGRMVLMMKIVVGMAMVIVLIIRVALMNMIMIMMVIVTQNDNWNSAEAAAAAAVSSSCNYTCCLHSGRTIGELWPPRRPSSGIAWPREGAGRRRQEWLLSAQFDLWSGGCARS